MLEIENERVYTNSILAIGLLVMMYPILCKVRFEALHRSFREKGLWVQVGFSIVVNWIIAPFFMVGRCHTVGDSRLI